MTAATRQYVQRRQNRYSAGENISGRSLDSSRCYLTYFIVMYPGTIASTSADQSAVAVADKTDAVRPPFDPELAPVLAAMREATPKTNQENLAEVRSLIADGIPGASPH